MTSTERLTLSEARALINAALIAQGVAADSAAAVATALVAAQAEGQSGHGFSRLGDYAAQARSGKVNPNAQITLHEASPTSVIVDADAGFAYPALDAAIEWGIERANSYGTAVMSVHHSHHCGALSVQVEKLAKQGLIGLMMANSPPAIAPWGTAKPVFGTNPIAFAAPRLDGVPLVIDLSLSRVARGKIMNAKKTGQSIPEGWALDANGHATTDPDAALAGSMIAAGEAKGTVLALMVEILAAVFTGANASADVSSFFTSDGPPPGAGQFLMAIRPNDADGFADRLEAVLSAIMALEGSRLPGDRRAKALRESEANGIDVPKQYVDLARELARG